MDEEIQKAEPTFLSWAWLRRFLSHDCSPFEQFMKYAAIGAFSTLIQLGVFYAFAATCLPCLKPDDWAVRLFGFASVQEGTSDMMRGFVAGLDMTLGFIAANIVCWLLNRWFVFKSGKYVWYKEFFLFFAVSAIAYFVGLGLQTCLIQSFGIMTTLAAFMEIVASLAINYFARKFFVFNG